MHIKIRHGDDTYISQQAHVESEAELENFVKQFGQMLNAGLSYRQNLANGNVLVLGPLATQKATFEFILGEPVKVKQKRLPKPTIEIKV